MPISLWLKLNLELSHRDLSRIHWRAHGFTVPSSSANRGINEISGGI